MSGHSRILATIVFTSFLASSCSAGDNSDGKKRVIEVYPTLPGLISNCEKSDAPSCYELGFTYELRGNEYGVEPDFEKSVSFYQKACDLNDGASCYYLADKIENKYNYDEYINTDWTAEKVDQLFIKSTELLQTKCENGDAMSCLVFAETTFLPSKLHDFGSDKRQIFWKKGNDIAIQECKDGKYAGCAFVASNSYNSKEVQTQKTKEALSIAESNCDDNILKACVFLVGQYENKLSGSYDAASTSRIFNKLCDNDIEKACNKIGRQSSQTEVKSKAKMKFGKSKCGVEGQWIRLTTISERFSMNFNPNADYQLRWTEGEYRYGGQVDPKDIVTFENGGRITGGVSEGMYLGGMTATHWKCDGTDRVILKDSSEEIAEMAKTLEFSVSEVERIYGNKLIIPDSTYVRYNSDSQLQKELAYDGLRALSEHEGSQFSKR